MKKFLSLFVFSLIALPGAALAIDYGGPYVEPNCAPPACNVAAPINVGISPQEKKGGLLINNPGTQAAFSVVGSSWFQLQPLQTAQSVVAHFLGKIRIGGGLPTKNKVLVAEDTNGNAIWKDLSIICQETGACGGNSTTTGGLPNGAAWQTLFWDGSGWKPSSNLINHDQAGNQFVQSNNLISSGYVTLLHKSPDNSIQYGSLLSSNYSLDITGVDNGVFKLVTIKDTLKTVNVEASNYIVTHKSPDGSIQNAGITASNYDLKISGVPGSGLKLVTVDDALNVLGTTQTNNIVIKNGAALGKILVSAANGNGIWTDPSSIFAGMAQGTTDGQVLRWNNSTKKWEPNSTLLLNNNGTTMQVSGNTRFGLSTAPVTLQTYKFQLSDSSAAAGRVLVASDPSGNSSWVDPSTLFGAGFWGGSATGNIYNTNSGNVGIGTQNPGSDLEVNKTKTGTTEIKTINGGTGQSIAQVGAYNTSASGFEDGTRIITTGPGYVNSGNNDPAFTSDTGILRSGANLRGLNISANAGNIQLFAGGTGPSIVVDRATGGNVGVGLTAPSTVLDVDKDSAGISLRTRGNLLLNAGPNANGSAVDGPRLIWRGGPANNSGYRARVGTDGSLGFFEKEGGSTALRIFQPNDSYYDVNPGMVYAPNLKSDALTATYAVAKHLQVDTRGSAFVPAKDKILVALNDNGDATWKTPADIGINGGATYTPGTGIAISASKVISNTSLNTDNQTLALSGNTLSISGGNSVTLPTGSSGGNTYTAGNGISINAANQIANTHVINISGNTLTLSPNGGSVVLPTELPVNPADGSTLYYRQDNNKWMTNPYLTYSSFNVLNLNGQFNANKTAVGTLQVTGGAGKVGQVLTSSDAFGSVIWEDVPTLPTGAAPGDTLYFNGNSNSWVKNTQLVTDGGNIGIKVSAASLANNTPYSLQVGGGILSDSVKTGGVTITTGAADGKVLTSDATGKASWQNPIVSAFFDSVSVTKYQTAANGIKIEPKEDNNWFGWGARDFVLMSCPDTTYTAIAGGAICDAGHTLSASATGDNAHQWRVSCGSELGYIQRVTLSCAKTN